MGRGVDFALVGYILLDAWVLARNRHMRKKNLRHRNHLA